MVVYYRELALRYGGKHMAEHSATLSSDSLDYLPGGSAAEKRSLAKWYAAAKLRWCATAR